MESEQRTIRVDNTAPDTVVTSSPSDPSNSATAAFEFSSPGDQSASFECKLDDGEWEPCSSPNEYTGLPDGEHVFRVRAVDAAGNANPSPAERRFTIDAGAPSAPEILSPATNRADDDGDFTVGGKAEPGSKVKLYEGGTLVAEATADESGDWSVDLRSVADGSHTYTATATDAAGNESGNSAAREVRVDGHPPDAPSVDLESSSDTGSYDADDTTSDATPTISGSAEPGSTVRLYEGGTLLGTATADENGGYTITLADPLTEGAHEITARATDEAGNTDQSPARRTFTVDFPEPPRADLSVRVGAPETVTQGAKFSYALTANNAGPDEARNTVLKSRLPRGVSFVSAPEGCAFSEKTRTVSCRLGDLGEGESRKVKITVRAERSGGFELPGSVSSATSDPRAANSSANTGTITTRKPAPQPQANLALRVDSPARITRGEEFPYTITVANLGPNTAKNTVVKSALPDAVSFVNAPRNCDYSRGERTLTCRLGDLRVDDRKQLKVTVRADRVGEADFRASVKSDTPDPVRSNDQDVS